MIRRDAYVIFNDEWFFKKLRNEAQKTQASTARSFANPMLSVDEDELDRNRIEEFSGRGTSQYYIIYEVYQHTLELIWNLVHESEFTNIRTAYRRVLQFEWLAQIELNKKRYRDHITHPVKVTMLGLWFLYDSKIFASPTILSIIKDKTRNYRNKHGIKINNWDHFLKQLWLITGIFHDFCYPVEFLLKMCHEINISDSYRIWSIYQKKQYHLVDILKELNDSIFLLNIDNNSKRARQKIKKAINNGKTNQSHLHAILGTLNLLMLCIENDSLHTEEGLMYQFAASAIFRHHEGKPVSFNDHPIDFLLVLCDTLQEWGRDCFIKRPAKGNRWIINNYVECDAVEANLKSVHNSIDFIFHAPSPSIRSKTGWKKEIFAEGKNKDIKLFNNHGSFPEIRFKV